MSAPTTTEQPAVTDPGQVPCPCCADIPWCPQEAAQAAAEIEAAPELILGATWRWS